MGHVVFWSGNRFNTLQNVGLITYSFIVNKKNTLSLMDNGYVTLNTTVMMMMSMIWSYAYTITDRKCNMLSVPK